MLANQEHFSELLPMNVDKCWCLKWTDEEGMNCELSSEQESEVDTNENEEDSILVYVESYVKVLQMCM